MVTDLLLRIQDITANDMRRKSIQDLFLSAAEELGEVAKEMAIEQRVYGHEDERLGEGVSGESVDLFICALALYFASGGSVEKLVAYATVKLDKWERAQREADAR